MRISDWSSDVCSSDLSLQSDDAVGPLRVRLEVVAQTGLDIEEVRDQAAIENLDFRLLPLTFQDVFALGLEEELVVVGPDPALGIPGVEVLPLVVQPVFVLVELKEGIDMVVHLRGRRRQHGSAAWRERVGQY